MRQLRSRTQWFVEHAVPRAVVRRAARAGDPQALLITDEAVRADPYPTLAAVRARGPLVQGRLSLVSATHAVAREVLGSKDFGTISDGTALPGPLRAAASWARDPTAFHPLDPPSLLVLEPPDHTRLRRLVSRVFTARAVEGLRARTEQIATELLDDLEVAGRAGPVDLVSAYATMLPVTVIAEILGVPPESRAQVLAFGAAAAPSLDLGLSWREYRGVVASLSSFDDWLVAHLRRLRERPGDDLLSQLVMLPDDGETIGDRELRAIAGLLLAAGFETTVNLLGSGTDLLLRHPDQLARLRADPTGWPNAVDELLRLESPVQVTARSARHDTRVAGIDVRAGSFVVLLLSGANRDPEVFGDPDRLDVARANAREHLSFSGGRHFCVGAALARMEGEVGLRALTERFPDLTLAPGAVRRPTRVLRGWQVLPVTTGAPAPALV